MTIPAPKTEKLHLYLVSDSSGETVTSIGRAAVSRFLDLEVVESSWLMVRSIEKVRELLAGIKKTGGIVVYTMVKGEIEENLVAGCCDLGVPCFSPLETVIEEIQKHSKVSPLCQKPGKNHQLDSNYFHRIESLTFTLNHDDGQGRSSYCEADVILLGVSRTSKSPTSLYLAQRGYRAANIPIIDSMPLKLELGNKNPLIVGLTIACERLVQLRRNRFVAYRWNSLENHLGVEAIKKEINYARQIFAELSIPVIDVTHRAIEEVAAEIINMIIARQEQSS